MLNTARLLAASSASPICHPNGVCLALGKQKGMGRHGIFHRADVYNVSLKRKRVSMLVASQQSTAEQPLPARILKEAPDMPFELRGDHD